MEAILSFGRFVRLNNLFGHRTMRMLISMTAPIVDNSFVHCTDDDIGLLPNRRKRKVRAEVLEEEENR